MIRVLIADDQELMRQSLEIVLSGLTDMDVVAIAADGEEVLHCLEKTQPDVILMDIRMPKMNGVQCTKAVKRLYPHIKIIILTTFDDDEYVFSALKYGASGYLLKGVTIEELQTSIRTVYEGGSLMNPDVASKVFREFSKLSQAGEESHIQIEERALEELSRNEWAIIREIGRGLSNKEIARALSFSEGTVRNYLSAVLSKLDLRDRTQLAIWAVRSGRADKEETQ